MTLGRQIVDLDRLDCRHQSLEAAGTGQVSVVKVRANRALDVRRGVL